MSEADPHDRRLRPAELRLQLLRHGRRQPRRVRDRAQDGKGGLDGYPMRLEIPAPLQAEHEELHAALAAATKLPGSVGAAAREVARLMHPHFAREEQFALPPLGLLADVVRGALRSDMAEVLPMTRRLKAELPAMFDEHRRIVG